MTENGIYFAKSEYYQLIRSLGGQWNDKKERPIVCLIKSKEHPDLYWAIPMGDWAHRDEAAQARIMGYINSDKRDIRSCYYHVGSTNKKSIFFISDAIPITDKYIDRAYMGYDQQIYVIQNPNLLAELQRKLFRILKVESTKPDGYRQHITSLKQYLLHELEHTVD